MKKLVCGTVFLSASLILGGCTKDGVEPEIKKESVANKQSDEGTKATDTTKFTNGDKEKIEKLVKQFPNEQSSSIVTTSVSIVEMLNILGVKPVGIPSTTHQLPEGFEEITKIGTTIEPDIEKVISLKPDIVVGPESIQSSLEKKITNAKLKTAYIPTDSYEDLKISLEVLGKVLHKEDKADAYLSKLTEKENEVLKNVEKKTPPKVAVLFGSGESFMLMSDNTYVGSLVKKLGAENIVTKAKKSKEAYVPMNIEDVIAANPDAILLVSHGDPSAALEQFKAEVKKNGAWEKLNAFKQDRVQALDYKVFGYASIEKATDGLEQLHEILYK